jgi:hypothetical protein
MPEHDKNQIDPANASQPPCLTAQGDTSLELRPTTSRGSANFDQHVAPTILIQPSLLGDLSVRSRYQPKERALIGMSGRHLRLQQIPVTG